MTNRNQGVWSPEEVQLLENQASRLKNRWQKIAQQLCKRGYTRSGSECRDKWVNSVDPSINRSDWRFEQLEKLHKLYAQHPNHWCIIKKQLGKTQMQIKNKFYSTLRQYIRVVFKSFLQKSNNFVTITATTLCAIYAAKGQFTFLGNQISSTIQKMRYKVDRSYLLSRIQSMQPLYRKLFEILSKTRTSQEEGSCVNIKEAQQENANNHLQLEPMIMFPWAQIPPIQMWTPMPPICIFYEPNFFSM